MERDFWMECLKTQEISSKNLIQSLPGDPILTVALIASLSYQMGTGDKAVLSHRGWFVVSAVVQTK